MYQSSFWGLTFLWDGVCIKDITLVNLISPRHLEDFVGLVQPRLIQI